MRQEIYGKELPIWLRMFGCWGWQQPSLRFWWGELSFSWGFALGYSIYHESAHLNIHIGPINLFLKMPMLITQRAGTEDYIASYGFTVFARDMHLNWRTRCKVIHFPWDWTHVRTSILFRDGSVCFDDTRSSWEAGAYEERKERIANVSDRHDYHYLLLPSGEVQKRTATIHGSEMEWRMRWFKWLPWPAKVQRSIEVEFSDEVGERSGSWKGGCTGCGYEWRDGETMLQSLRRMERERRFA